MDKRIGDQLPSLTTLVLTSNLVKEVGDLDGLSKCYGLTHLSLLENPVTKKEHYRSYLIWLIPSLRFLDFQRVREVEREQAKELFGTQAEPSELAAKMRGVKSKAMDSSAGATKGASTAKAMRTQLTDSEKKRVQELIKNARSLAEIARIEKDLAEGRIPQGAADADRMVS